MTDCASTPDQARDVVNTLCRTSTFEPWMAERLLGAIDRWERLEKHIVSVEEDVESMVRAMQRLNAAEDTAKNIVYELAKANWGLKKRIRLLERDDD